MFWINPTPFVLENSDFEPLPDKSLLLGPASSRNKSKNDFNDLTSFLFVFLAVFNNEHDIVTYTIKAVDDPRTLNKILYIKPPNNTYSFNELVSVWEKKIGKSIEKTYVPEEQVLKLIQESGFPINILLAINHSIFVNGDLTNFEIAPSFGVEASELYPDVKYTTVDEYLDRFV